MALDRRSFPNALCTGINLILVSWPEFQKKVKYAEHLFNQKLVAATVTVADEQRSQHQRFLCIILPTLTGYSRNVWRATYACSLITAIFGIALLYFDWKFKYDYLLLLPTTIYLLWTYAVLLIIIGWIWIVKSLLKLINSPNTDKIIKDFTEQVKKDLDR